MPARSQKTAHRRRSDGGGHGRPAAYPGRLAKAHKAAWLRARDQLRDERVPPSTRALLQVLVDRVAAQPQHRGYWLGYGGWKDREHREHVEQLRAAGLPPKDGAAELSGMSRSSMIRARRRLAQQGMGWVRVIVGRGRGNANEYRLVGAPAPGPRFEAWAAAGAAAVAPAPVDPEPQAPPAPGGQRRPLAEILEEQRDQAERGP